MRPAASTASAPQAMSDVAAYAYVCVCVWAATSKKDNISHHAPASHTHLGMAAVQREKQGRAALRILRRQ